MTSSPNSLKVTSLASPSSSRSPSLARRTAKPVNTVCVRPLRRRNIARASAPSAGLFKTVPSIKTVVSAPNTTAPGFRAATQSAFNAALCATMALGSLAGSSCSVTAAVTTVNSTPS